MTEQDPLQQEIPGTRTQSSQVPAASPNKSPEERRQQARLTVAAIIGIVLVLFAVLNLNSVKVHWLFLTGSSPLILVIVVSVLLGMAGDRLLIRRQAKRRSSS